jgi:hypothetical protein
LLPVNDFVRVKATVCERDRTSGSGISAVFPYIPQLRAAHTFVELVPIDLCVQAQAAAPAVYWKDIPSGREVNGVYRARRITGLICEISSAPRWKKRERLNTPYQTAPSLIPFIQ